MVKYIPVEEESFIVVEKKKLRQIILGRLARQEEKERSKRSREILKMLFSSPEFVQARTIMFYVAKGDEVDTYPMIQKALELGKRVVVPVTKKEKKELVPSLLTDCEKQLEKGPYGVYQPARRFQQPVSVEEIDLAVVPGVAFDLKGNRLGRGEGYYDRFLKGLPRDVPAFGLAFKFQVESNLPTLSHDVSVDKVLSA